METPVATKEATPPVSERISELFKTLDKDQQVFVLLTSPKDERIQFLGPDSRIIGVGLTYESMWEHAGALLDMSKEDMRKHGYVFDYVTIRDAKKHVG